MVSLENMLVTHCQDNYGFWVQTLTGDASYNGDDYSGGFVLKQDIDCSGNTSEVKVGDRINLNPTNINIFFGQTQLLYQSSTLLSENNSLPVPAIAPVSDLGGISSVPLEGVLLKIENTTVTSLDVPNNSFEVDNTLTIDDRLYLASPFPSNGFNYQFITGIMSYSNGKSKLLPRFEQDLVLDVTNTTIYEVKQSNVTGLVSINNVLVTHCHDNYGFWIQTIIGDDDYSGNDYSGGFVLKQDIACTGDDAFVNIGDRIDLDYALIDTFFQQIQLQYISSTVLSNNNSLPDPVIATVANLSGSTPAALEGVLVKIENTIVTSLDIADNSFEVDNTLIIDDRLFLVSPFPTINFNYSSITGISWFSFNQSKLIPRYSQDIYEANGSATNLVINEVDYDQPGPDDREFVEIFNPTNLPISLTGKVLYFIAGTNTPSIYAQYDLSDVGTLLPGQYLVIGDETALINTAVGAHTKLLTGNIQNGANDGLVLVDTINNSLIDGMSYEGFIGSVMLTDIGITVNVTEGTSSLDDIGDGSLSRIANGQDTDNNDSDFVFTVNITPGLANSS